MIGMLTSIHIFSFSIQATTTSQIPSIHQVRPGSVKKYEIKFEDLFTACPEIANNLPKRTIYKDLIGSMIAINGKKFEIRNFSYEDCTEDQKYKNTTFKEFIIKNEELSKMTSNSSSFFEKIYFESFGSCSLNPKEKVYVMIVLRLHDEDPLE